jgi:hypothetical protein
MGEGYAAIQRGGGAAFSCGWGHLMTQSSGAVTHQSKTFKYVKASEPYRYTRYIKQVCHTLRFTFLNSPLALKVKWF